MRQGREKGETIVGRKGKKNTTSISWKRGPPPISLEALTHGNGCGNKRKEKKKKKKRFEEPGEEGRRRGVKTKEKGIFNAEDVRYGKKGNRHANDRGGRRKKKNKVSAAEKERAAE